MNEPAGFVQVSKGDPVYAIWIWRQDSITLARMRAPLGSLMEMANSNCEHAHRPLSCPQTGERDNHWCWPCRLKRLVLQFQAATSVRTEATNERITDGTRQASAGDGDG